MRTVEWVREHKYSLVGLYLVFFLAGFFLVERLIPEPVYVIHSRLDDWIPFNEWFVLPYFLWYGWVPAFLLIFMVRDKEAYLRLCFNMFTGATLCLLIYWFWPNGLDLRREVTADNFCGDIVRFLRSIDSPCNVCPSLHVSTTVAIHLAIGRSTLYRENRKVRRISLLVTFLICVSTMFIKQHSIIDVVCGWGLSRLLEALGARLFRRAALN